MLHVMFGNSE